MVWRMTGELGKERGMHLFCLPVAYLEIAAFCTQILG